MHIRMDERGDLRLSEILAALSYALDITEGQPRGHAVRTCLIGMRLAERARASTTRPLRALLRAAAQGRRLLVERGQALRALRRRRPRGQARPQDRRPLATCPRRCATSCERRRRRVAALARPALRASAGRRGSRALTELRCERGAEIARMLGLPEADRERDPRARRALGRPRLPATACAARRSRCSARILCLAQTAEVFCRPAAPDARRRRGARAHAARGSTRSSSTRLRARLRDDDASGRSLRDARACAAVARAAPTAADPPTTTASTASPRPSRAWSTPSRRTPTATPRRRRDRGLDIGDGARPRPPRELARPAPRRPAARHRQARRLQPDPRQARQADDEPSGPRCAATRVDAADPPARRPASHGLAAVAAAHHERLDGTRLPPRPARRRSSTAPARILAVADVSEALTAERPYRAAMPAEQALAIMRETWARSSARTRVDGALSGALPAQLAAVSCPHADPRAALRRPARARRDGRARARAADGSRSATSGRSSALGDEPPGLLYAVNKDYAAARPRARGRRRGRADPARVRRRVPAHRRAARPRRR